MNVQTYKFRRRCPSGWRCSMWRFGERCSCTSTLPAGSLRCVSSNEESTDTQKHCTMYSTTLNSTRAARYTQVALSNAFAQEGGCIVSGLSYSGPSERDLPRQHQFAPSPSNTALGAAHPPSERLHLLESESCWGVRPLTHLLMSPEVK